MADGTHIEWTDATWNVVNGCSVTSPGCTNCYAMRLAGTRLKHVESRKGLTIDSKAGPVWNGTTKFNEPVLLDPIRWKRPRRIFVCAHGDLFHDSVPDAWIDRVFAVMALAPQHQFQVLTKRSTRMRDYLAERKANRPASVAIGDGTLTDHPWNNELMPPQNVWLGVSVEDQTRADERIPDLLATPAAVRWISAEPLLGPVDLTRVRRFRAGVADKEFINAAAGRMWSDQAGLPNPDPAWGFPGVPFSDGGRGVDWVVAGGESGPGARPMHPDWARSLRDQCEAAGVAFLFKQWGEHVPCVTDHDGERLIVYDDGVDCAAFASDRPHPLVTVHGREFWRVGKKAAGRHLDGVTHDSFPFPP